MHPTTLVHINEYNTTDRQKVGDFDKKIPDTIGLVSTLVLNTKISEVENKILDSNRLLTTTVFNTEITEAENKIPGHTKYIITQEFNTLTVEIFAARLTQANLY